MWIVINIPGDDERYALIATDEEGENLLFETEDDAIAEAKETCAWGYKVVKI